MENIPRKAHRGPLNARQIETLKYARKLLEIRITYRELECGKFLMMGYSASSTAKALNISKRTVEYYIDNLKLKCNCDSKWQLSCYLCDRLNFQIPNFEEILRRELSFDTPATENTAKVYKPRST